MIDYFKLTTRRIGYEGRCCCLGDRIASNPFRASYYPILQIVLLQINQPIIYIILVQNS